MVISSFALVMVFSTATLIDLGGCGIYQSSRADI